MCSHWDCRSRRARRPAGPCRRRSGREFDDRGEWNGIMTLGRGGGEPPPLESFSRIRAPRIAASTGVVEGHSSPREYGARPRRRISSGEYRHREERAIRALIGLAWHLPAVVSPRVRSSHCNAHRGRRRPFARLRHAHRDATRPRRRPDASHHTSATATPTSRRDPTDRPKTATRTKIQSRASSGRRGPSRSGANARRPCARDDDIPRERPYPRPASAPFSGRDGLRRSATSDRLEAGRGLPALPITLHAHPRTSGNGPYAARSRSEVGSARWAPS
jgi:hypothetical protein